MADFDQSIPLLVVKVGRYPLGYSGIGAARSLGRVGVPVFVVAEDRFTPLARSRYVTRALIAPTTGREDCTRLVEVMKELELQLPGPAVVVATDDEAAVLLAEHATEFGPQFIMPAISPSLPRTLASKRGMYEMCALLDFATPRAFFPDSAGEIADFAHDALFPVVVKNVAAFERLSMPAVAHTLVVSSPDELMRLAKDWPDAHSAVIQEYVPDGVSEDWIFHGYFDASSECLAGFTGVKYRSWPPRTGVTTYARTVANDDLAERVCALVRTLDYRGVLDLDLRFDRRDGRYKLLDFNPRLGAQFRMFETDAGIDVVRAMHLDLTGRAVPPGRQVDGRGFVLEHLDLPAIAAYRRLRTEPGAVPHGKGRVERALFAADDPVPALLMAARSPSLVRDRFARR